MDIPTFLYELIIFRRDDLFVKQRLYQSKYYYSLINSVSEDEDNLIQQY